MALRRRALLRERPDRALLDDPTVPAGLCTPTTSNRPNTAFSRATAASDPRASSSVPTACSLLLVRIGSVDLTSEFAQLSRKDQNQSRAETKMPPLRA
jgi:hypothetical protein